MTSITFIVILFVFLVKECQKKLEHKLGLDSYLLKPVQRLTKYQLLLKVRQRAASCHKHTQSQWSTVCMSHRLLLYTIISMRLDFRYSSTMLDGNQPNGQQQNRPNY